MKALSYFVIFFFACSLQVAFAAGSAGVDLSQSLEKAFAYSPSLQKVQEARQQAEHEVRRAEAGYYPTIGIWGGAGVVQEDTESTRSTNTGGEAMGTSNFGLTFSQRIWQGGATSSLVRSNESSLEASIFTVLDDATALAYSAISVHADVVRREELFGLSEQNVAEHKKILKLLNSRFAEGLSSRGDVEQVVSRLSRAEATHMAYKEGLDAAFANYRRITGQHAPENLVPVPNPLRMFDSAKSVRDLCVQYNFSLHAVLAQIDALIGERDHTRASFAPYLSLDAGPSYSNVDRGGDAHELSWTAMLNIQWNLFNGGADVATFKASAAKVREARKALHDTMDVLDTQIELAYNRTSTALNQSFAFDKASKASLIARDNFFEQFQVGQKDLLNVLDAETEAFTSASETIITRVDAILGQYRMHALAGTLLKTVGIDSESVSKGIPNRMPVDDVKIWAFDASPKEYAPSRLLGSTLQKD